MSEPRSIGAIIRREQKRLWKTCPGLGLQSLWEQAAGPEIAAHAAVKSLRGGIMTVRCSSGAWACELGLRADELLENLNRLNPPGEVREIRFAPAVQRGWKSRK